MASLDQTSSGIPHLDWPERSGGARRATASAGIPEMDLLQGRALSEFVAARGTQSEGLVQAAQPLGADDLARAAHDPRLELRLDREERELAPHPGGAVGGGRRSPSGPVGRPLRGAPDFRQRSTGFYQSWGRPPDSEFFKWDPSIDLYRPTRPRSSSRRSAAERQWYEAVHRHHLELAGRGIHLQAFKAGGAGGSGGWGYRWMTADPTKGLNEQTYSERATGYASLGYRGPSVADLRRQLDGQTARAREGTRLMEEIGRAYARGSERRSAALQRNRSRWVYIYYGFGTRGSPLWEVKEVRAGQPMPVGAVLLAGKPSQAVIDGLEFPPEISGR